MPAATATVTNLLRAEAFRRSATPFGTNRLSGDAGAVDYDGGSRSGVPATPRNDVAPEGGSRGLRNPSGYWQHCQWRGRDHAAEQQTHAIGAIPLLVPVRGNRGRAAKHS